METTAAAAQPSQAEQAVAFAARYGTGAFRPEPPAAVAAAPGAYRALVERLQQMPAGSGFVWVQQIWGLDTRPGPFTPALGEAERVYEDGSRLSVMIRTDQPEEGPGPRWEIATSITVANGDGTGERQIHFTLYTGATEVIRRESAGLSEMLRAVTATAQQILESGITEETMETHLGAALAEAGLEDARLHPGTDSQVEVLRTADAGYRAGSDQMRAGRAAREQARASGLNEQPAGTSEIGGLGRLLASL
jgi:hypothetical protein